MRRIGTSAVRCAQLAGRGGAVACIVCNCYESQQHNTHDNLFQETPLTVKSLTTMVKPICLNVLRVDLSSNFDRKAHEKIHCSDNSGSVSHDRCRPRRSCRRSLSTACAGQWFVDHHLRRCFYFLDTENTGTTSLGRIKARHILSFRQVPAATAQNPLHNAISTVRLFHR